MFPYMAIAIENENPSFDSIHSKVYTEASSTMLPKDFEAISSRQPELLQNADAFKATLKYFKIKPGYNLLVKIFHSLGFNLLASTYLPSVISYFIIGCILMAWLQRISFPPLYQFTTLVLMASPFLFTTARFSSPDMLCAVMSFAGLFILIEISVLPGLIILSLAITARPDAVIFNIVACLALYKSKKLNIKRAILFITISLISSLSIIHSPQLIKEYFFTNTSYSTEWSSGEVLINYSKSLVAGFNSVLSSQIILFTFIGAILVYLRKRKGLALMKDMWSLLMIASTTTFIIRYLFHPDVEDRFLIGCYLIILMGLCVTMGEFLLPRKANVITLDTLE